MERVEKILNVLKPKASAYGFNRKELESVASIIDGNLELEEDVSDEDVNAAIGKAVDAVIPVLKLAQASASRAIAAARKVSDHGDDDDDESHADNDGVKSGSKSRKEKQDGNKGDDSPEWAKKMFSQLEDLQNKIAGLEKDKVSDSRRNKLDTLLKDTGAFGKSYIRTFSKMQFKDDDDFEDFLSGVKEDLSSFNQELANAGLATLGAAPVGCKKENMDNVKPLDETELNEIVNIM